MPAGFNSPFTFDRPSISVALFSRMNDPRVPYRAQAGGDVTVHLALINARRTAAEQGCRSAPSTRPACSPSS